jgi:hypothetical protein
MKSLEYLMQLHPDKTATEILAIQAEEKAADLKAEQKRNAKVLAFIADLNANGGYYRGKFGLDQHYYYKVTNLRMCGDEVMMDVDKIVLFCNADGHQHTVCKPNCIHIDRELEKSGILSQYGLDSRERVTVKEWDEINAYLDAMSKLFWK